jgi:hypothetical protein
MGKWRWVRRWSRGFGGAAGLASVAAVLTTFGCGDDTEACLSYACSTSANLAASVPCAEPNATFEVTLCHGDECSTAVIAWSRETEQSCTDNLAPDAGPSGFQQTRTVCAEAEEQAVVFTGYWDSGREGIPNRKTFRLRVADSATGDVLLDESANGDFEPSASYDHCPACYQATIDLGASPVECSASGG